MITILGPDAAWFAKLLQFGLIEGSFVPSPEIRGLRDLTWYREKLVQDATSEKNRIHRLLQDANIKLTTHMSDIFGVSGRILLQKIMDGAVITLEFLESEMKGALRHKSAKLLQSLNSRLRRHHRDMLRFSYEHRPFIERAILELEHEIRAHIVDKQEALELITTVPGINTNAAAIILVEIGTDMEQFSGDKQLAAWSAQETMDLW
ncbi:transposase [Alicyclobacillus curvatus]|nr:transposase [Alicyclobacillus curvatus]